MIPVDIRRLVREVLEDKLKGWHLYTGLPDGDLLGHRKARLVDSLAEAIADRLEATGGALDKPGR